MVIVFFCLCLYPPDTTYWWLCETRSDQKPLPENQVHHRKKLKTGTPTYLGLSTASRRPPPKWEPRCSLSEPFKLRHFLAIKRRISLFKYKLRQGFAKNYRAKQLRRLRIQSIHTNAWAILSKFRICRKYRATVLNYEYI